MEQVKLRRTPTATAASQYFPDIRIPAALSTAAAAAILAIASQASAQQILDISGEARIRLGSCPTADSATPDDDNALPSPCQKRAKAAKKTGATKPKDDALEPPFEDPLYPAELAFDCFLENDPAASDGYRLQRFESTDNYGITDEPKDVTDVRGLTHVVRQAIFQDARVGVELRNQTGTTDILPGHTDAVRYRLKQPIRPYQRERCKFKRIVPPAASTDSTGLETINVPLTVVCDDKTPMTCSVDLGDKKPQPEGLVCQANNFVDPNTSIPGANVHCWQERDRGTRVWGGKLDLSDPSKLGKEQQFILKRR